MTEVQPALRIGDLAQLTGASRRSIRHYEKLGLLRSDREANGYRVYEESAVTSVLNIRRLLDIGLQGRDIVGMSTCLESGAIDEQTVCAATLVLLERRLQTVESSIESMVEMRDRLRAELEEFRKRLDHTLQAGRVVPSAPTDCSPYAG